MGHRNRVDPALRQPGRPPGTKPRISVVMPALNEARNLPPLFAQLSDDVFEVILVDGASVDGTVEVARALRPDVRVVYQNRRGKGNALACGFAQATGDIIVMLDADMSADPGEIDAFVQALLGGAHFAKGSRFVEGGGSDDITGFRAWGNRWLNRLVNSLYRTSYTDLCYGYNAFWAECLPHLRLDDPQAHDGNGSKDPGRQRWGDGFEVEALIHARVSAAHMVVAEVPSFEARRLHGESNLRAVRDGFRVLRTIATERHRLRRCEPLPELPRPWTRFVEVAPDPPDRAPAWQHPVIELDSCRDH
ncbi:MAG TPA: glycosyltransferase family 2 protein [Mycobacteriales bacterium]|nr:glycosyltransferase family 2 protein [Mycobacteriales bacterium]